MRFFIFKNIQKNIKVIYNITRSNIGGRWQNEKRTVQKLRHNSSSRIS